MVILHIRVGNIWNLERNTLHLRIKNEDDRSFLAYIIDDYEPNKLKKAQQ
jgi:hypothetical protein